MSDFAARAHDRPVPSRVFWILPLIFAVHDGEELATMPAWLAAHRDQLPASLTDLLATTYDSVAIAIAAVALAVLVVTLGASIWPNTRAWVVAYATVLGVLFLHVFTHIGQAIWLRGYVPGLYGAVAVVLPGGAYLYYRLIGARWLTWTTAIVAAIAGLVCLPPLALAAHSLGRALAGR